MIVEGLVDTKSKKPFMMIVPEANDTRAMAIREAQKYSGVRRLFSANGTLLCIEVDLD
jgi:hypothetical protein